MMDESGDSRARCVSSQRLGTRGWVAVLLRWAVAGIFIYAAIEKIISPLAFADSIASFQLLPKEMINLVALGLPPLEIVLGLAVLTGFYRRPALLGVSVLMLIFILALVSAIVRGIPVDCGCFGSSEPSVAGAWIAIGRDLPILAAAIWLYIREYFVINSSSSSL